MKKYIKLYRYIPNTLTLLRMASAPFLFCALQSHNMIAALVLVSFAIVSDMSDGYVARRLVVSSKSGSFLDPLADKAFIITAFAALCMQKIVPWWVLWVIIGRDMSVTWLRIFLLRRGVSLRTSWFAKSKTAFQFTALYVFIICAMYPLFSSAFTARLFCGISWIVALLTVASAYGYVRHLVCMLRNKGSKNAH